MTLDYHIKYVHNNIEETIAREINIISNKIPRRI